MNMSHQHNEIMSSTRRKNLPSTIRKVLQLRQPAIFIDASAGQWKSQLAKAKSLHWYMWCLSYTLWNKGKIRLTQGKRFPRFLMFVLFSCQLPCDVTYANASSGVPRISPITSPELTSLSGNALPVLIFQFYSSVSLFWIFFCFNSALLWHLWK